MTPQSAAPNAGVVEPTSDGEFYGWLDLHPAGFVLNVKGKKKPVLHRAECGNIRTHNNPGAMTTRESRKICGETKDALRAWTKEHGLGNGITLERCRSCSP